MAALTSDRLPPGAGADWQAVVNAAGHHSVWPAEQEPPAGWSATGPTASREDCLDWIAAHWFDPRPAGVGQEVPRT
jgi:MbtH protein